MPLLKNPKHEAFAQALSAGMSASGAYTVAGYKPSDAHASRLAGNGKVGERVAELKAKTAERVSITAESLVDELIRDRDMARDLGKPEAAIRATTAIADILGITPDKRKNERSPLTDLGDDQVTAELERLRRERAQIEGRPPLRH